MRVVAALSGGVDSAVAAARLLDAGHEVVGVHLVFAGEAVADAGHVAETLGIPHEVVDLRTAFEEIVVTDFVSGYAAGRTPNPCVLCNPMVKFAALFGRADQLGFDAVATGHYARLVRGAAGSVELHRSSFAAKDQSYVLAALGMERLARLLFPLGDAGSKAEVRAEAEARGLPVAARPDSLDACFVADGDVAGFLRGRLGAAPGEVVDQAGAPVGKHEGAYAYTIGQRKGLRLPRPAADGRPRYVTEVRAGSNTVVVGPEEALVVHRLEGDAAAWLAVDLPSDTPVQCEIQVRAHGEPAPARVTVRGDRMVVDLEEPMRAVAAGQALVAYRGTRVLGHSTSRPRTITAPPGG